MMPQRNMELFLRYALTFDPATEMYMDETGIEPPVKLMLQS